ncbi:GNAT family N-acetyltransferase [Anaerocolumna sedimenticola]|uniref:GNAT family N-acetyltransferase n=1 Tax=Anaerocolumna sedimenticola TaxID=2696063 RepID=A0A6P1TQF0_9FIRM|nr:GNAT family N-acetyltransferase [Anaerocolumna sedimenticola]QHQ63490.1 GNAT family N-acetyltransferase [Anaerocolumna sedimenticola]
MLIRQAKLSEREELFREAYKEWSKNRTFEQYKADNSKEDEFGVRYVIEEDGKIVSSLIMLNLKELFGYKVYGFGSVLTPLEFAGKGYATSLLNDCMGKIDRENSIIFLYSEINPVFYERLGFKILPSYLQKDKKAVCMALCKDIIWLKLQNTSINRIPDYF